MPPLAIQLSADELLLGGLPPRAPTKRPPQSGGAARLDVYEGPHHLFQQSTELVPRARLATDAAARLLSEHWAYEGRMGCGFKKMTGRRRSSTASTVRQTIVARFRDVPRRCFGGIETIGCSTRDLFEESGFHLLCLCIIQVGTPSSEVASNISPGKAAMADPSGHIGVGRGSRSISAMYVSSWQQQSGSGELATTNLRSPGPEQVPGACRHLLDLRTITSEIR